MLSIKGHTPEDFSENKDAQTETLLHELCTLVLGHIQIFENGKKGDCVFEAGQWNMPAIPTSSGNTSPLRVLTPPGDSREHGFSTWAVTEVLRWECEELEERP